MPARVADTSVLAAWFFDQPNRTRAGELIEGFELFAPDLVFYELANVAWVKMRQTPTAAGGISEALSDAQDFQMTTVRVPATSLLNIARNFRVTAYDAAYIWVAQVMGCSMATFDRRLAKAAEAAGLSAAT